MPRVLLVAGDATESLDTWYPYHRLREEGIEVHIGAPAKKALNSVIHDFEPGWDTYVEKPGYRIPADIAFADIEPEDYDAIILSGGRAPEYLRNDPQLQKIVRHFVAHKKPIAALTTARLSSLRSTPSVAAPSPLSKLWLQTLNAPGASSRIQK